MTSEKYDNFKYSFNTQQQEIKEFRRKRNQLNKKIKDYINNFQMIESEIYKSLFDARKVYRKNRHFCYKNASTTGYRGGINNQAHSLFNTHYKTSHFIIGNC